MGTGGGDGEPDTLGGTAQLPPDMEDVVAKLRDVAADLGADLDDRLMELALDLFAESRGAGGEKLGHVRAQFPGFRIDDLEFFLHADGEPMGHALQSCHNAFASIGRRTSTGPGA